MDKKIKVGMDISQIAHQGGVSTYTNNLTKELSEISYLDMKYFYSSLRKTYNGDLKNVKSFKLPPTLFEILFNRLRIIPIERFIGDCDIFHSSDWTYPPSKAKKITTIHDVIPLKYEKWSKPEIVRVHKRKFKLIEEDIDMVIAVSEATKKDILEISNIPKEKIKVIYEGPTANFKKQSNEIIQKFKSKYKLPEKFILAIGGIGERKNLERIKEACKDHNLVITGNDIPWLNIEELEVLYSAANALVYCSLYEGFGLPILDAFSCGLPVITSNVSSMPEVGGDAVIYTDSYRIEDMKEKINLVLNDNDLSEKLIKKGLDRVKQFSWKKAAQETAQLYKNLI